MKKTSIKGLTIFFASCALMLSGCQTNPKDDPKEEYATITVVDGTGSGEYKIGDTATITATIPEGKEFHYWALNNVTNVSEDNPYTFTVTEDASYVAKFLAQKVTLTVVDGTGSGTYDYGSLVTVSSLTKENQKFVEWDIDGVKVSESDPYSFIIKQDTTITGIYESVHPFAKYTHTLTMDGDEFTILNLTDIQLDNGNNVTFTKYLIDSCIAYKKPDLITILGDIINDSIDYDADEIAEDIFDLIESYEIPWAPIFGNHDQANYQDSSMSIKSIGSKELAEMLSNKTKYPHCLYLNGPEDVEGLSNYLINVQDEDGNLVESLIFMDSLKHGLNDTHIAFYEDCVNYAKELNDEKVVPSVVFDHIPLPEYVTEYNKLRDDLFRNANGHVCTIPLCNGNTDKLFPKFKELGSTRTMLCGHDHVNAYYSEVDGIKLGYAMKTSESDDRDGNPYKYAMGGCYLTIDGVNEDRIEYHPVNDFDYTVVANVYNGFDYHFGQIPYWRGSGAKIKFDITLPDSGTLNIGVFGTNLINPKEEEAYASWNRLTETLKLDASEKTLEKGILTQVKDNKYTAEIDLLDLSLNNGSGEQSFGDETARLIYFSKNTMEYQISNIHFEYEEVTETDQLDLANATITPIENQPYQKGALVRPSVEVKLDGKTLSPFVDYIPKFSNNQEIGTANLEIVPSGKGAHKYKGSTSTTFEIVGNPFRGDAFSMGYTRKFSDLSLEETIVFDVHFTSTGSTMWFMLGDGWDKYFGYYGLKSDGTLDDTYSGVSVQVTEDDYVRVTCVLSLLNKQNGGTPNPTEKVNMFFVHKTWGNSPTGYIDFNTSDGPSVVRGKAFSVGVDADTRFNLPIDAVLVVDFRFTSSSNTYISFMIGNTADNWGHYYGYYALNADGTLEKNYDGITLSKTSDGYIRLTIKLAELTVANNPPSADLGFNIFYIRGGWSNASGYYDINPTVD